MAISFVAGAVRFAVVRGVCRPDRVKFVPVGAEKAVTAPEGEGR
jgi:hypothetical protein